MSFARQRRSQRRGPENRETFETSRPHSARDTHTRRQGDTTNRCATHIYRCAPFAGCITRALAQLTRLAPLRVGAPASLTGDAPCFTSLVGAYKVEGGRVRDRGTRPGDTEGQKTTAKPKSDDQLQALELTFSRRRLHPCTPGPLLAPPWLAAPAPRAALRACASRGRLRTFAIECTCTCSTCTLFNPQQRMRQQFNKIHRDVELKLEATNARVQFQKKKAKNRCRV